MPSDIYTFRRAARPARVNPHPVGTGMWTDNKARIQIILLRVKTRESFAPSVLRDWPPAPPLSPRPSR